MAQPAPLGRATEVTVCRLQGVETGFHEGHEQPSRAAGEVECRFAEPLYRASMEGKFVGLNLGELDHHFAMRPWCPSPARRS